MQEKKRYDRLDAFRLAAAALVAAIHTSPLMSFSEDADFFLTRVLARTAVPFFFMVTGQFITGGLPDEGAGRVLRYVKKIALFYGIAVMLYLPLGIYAGHYEKIGIAEAFRMLFFDGTFYHLWYFPACITGVLLVYLMSRFLSGGQMFSLAAVLYGIGLLGDSYYGWIENVPAAARIYEAAFSVFSYTRNGIFMAPIFLLLGGKAGKSSLRDRRVLWTGFFVSFIAMTEEAFLLRYFEMQRHDSMYVMLPFVMFFLYKLLLPGFDRETSGTAQRGSQTKGKVSGIGQNAWIQNYAAAMSTWIYLLHPAVIVVVRAAAKAAKMKLLVENSLVHYAAVLGLSAAAAFFISLALNYFKRKQGHRLRNKSSRSRNRCRRNVQNQQEYRIEPFRRGRAWLELDRKALRQNAAALQKMLPGSCKLMPAVKADAYGHGAVLVADELQKAGVNAFCVACVWEGVQLRRKGIQGLILILGYTHPEQSALLCRYQLTQTIVDYAYALQLNAYGKTIHVHIGIDTGMHRLGVRSQNLEQILEIYGMEHLSVDGLFTHLCASDMMTGSGQNYTRMQAEAFYCLLSKLSERGYPCPKIHMQASYGVLNYPELAGDYARVGIALYGVLSTKEDTAIWQKELKPVLSLKARIAAVKTLYRGESAGYGMQFTASQDMKIAALAIGYADGLPRALSSGVGRVLIHGRYAPVIGRICMDQTIVDVSGIENVHAGDEAVLIGRCGDLEISVCDMAKQAGTITNEILSRMGARLERIFV